MHVTVWPNCGSLVGAIMAVVLILAIAIAAMVCGAYMIMSRIKGSLPSFTATMPAVHSTYSEFLPCS